jgi:hypothetical protein
MTDSPWGPEHLKIMSVLDAELHTIAEVVQVLTDLQILLEQADPIDRNNGVADFNRLYRTITAEILEHLEAGAFTDPTFLTLLDIEFAKRYLNALRRWGQSSDDTPEAWRVLFEKLHDQRVHPLPAAAAGVNAHINYDLPFALINTWEGLDSSPDNDAQHADYLLINDVFAAKIPGLRRGYLNAWQLFFDRINGTLDDWIEDRAVELTRDLAWHDGRRLWAMRRDHDAINREECQLDRQTAFLGWVLLSPAFRFLQ